MVVLLMLLYATGASLSSARDYYEILGVHKDSTRDEIKNAFHAVSIHDLIIIVSLFYFLL